MSKFKVGEKVKWKSDYCSKGNTRVDIITSIVKDVFGSTRYYTKEINSPDGQKPKIGLAFENYLVKA